MKRIAALVVGLVLVALPAMAKGPVSATIDGPGIGETILVDWQPGNGLNELVESIGYWNVVWSSDENQSKVTAVQPTKELGDAYMVGVTVIGPGGDAYFPVTVYPHAEGGPVVFAEGGVHVKEMQSETTGGWYRTPHDVIGVFEDLGVVWPTVEKVTVLDQPTPPPVQSAAPAPTDVEATSVIPMFLIVAGLTGFAAFWVIRRHPRRLRAS